MRKIFILFLFFIVTNCSSFNITSNEAICPKLTSPKGAEEILLKSRNGVETYIGFRGIKTKCYKAGSSIKMTLEVNIRAIRKNINSDDYLPITLALVSINEKRSESDRDEISFDFFLRSKSRLIERVTKMKVIIPKNGEALIGILKKN